MTFGNSILAGEDLVRTGIRSPDFQTGVAGWRIARDGSAEFNDVLVRGTFETGASGQRIVITGAPLTQILLFTGDVDEDQPPFILSDVQGAGPARNLELLVSSGAFVGQLPASLHLYSESDDGTEGPVAVFDASDIQLNTAGTAPSPFNSLPRGIAAAQTLAANDAARAPGANTDMVITPNVVAGRSYPVHLHSQLNFGTPAAVYALGLTDNGAAAGRFDRWTAADTPAGSTTGHTSSTVLWTPSTSGAHTLRVVNDAGSGGTVTLTAAAGNPRSFWTDDVGVT